MIAAVQPYIAEALRAITKELCAPSDDGPVSCDGVPADFDAKISELTPTPLEGRSLVLALNDYPVLQTGSGGISRIRGLLTHLNADVVLISFGASYDVERIAPTVLHATVPKTTAHLAFERAANDGQPASVNDGVASLFAATNQALTALVCKFASRAGAVILEHPYMTPMLDCISAVRPGLPVIYSAHNVEATHKKELLTGHRLANTLATFIAELERRLVAQSRLVVCCTEADAAHFASAAVETLLVPNGCTLPDQVVFAVAREHRQGRIGCRLGFMGSAHRPNVEAAMFIVRELAAEMPNVSFELIGSVCAALELPLPSNVILHGMVAEPEKTMIMAGWDIALNPVQSGGGSSVKLPDYMAHALATLNTPAGTRGFAVEEHDAGRVVERGRFRNVLSTMLDDRQGLMRQQVNARRYAAERLTWDAITAPYRQYLDELLSAPFASP
jgi:hypothetical protein